jgi:hypothetical protein
LLSIWYTSATKQELNMKTLVTIVAFFLATPALAARVDVLRCGGSDSDGTSTFVTVTKADDGKLSALVEFSDSALDRSAQFAVAEVQAVGAGVFWAKDFSLTVDAGIGLRKGTLQLPAIHVYDQLLSCTAL